MKLQSTMLKELHHGHQGGESMIRRWREVIYWPVMQAAILQESGKCSLCASFCSAFPKNRCCLTKFHKINGNSSRRTYSSRVGVGILLQLTTTVIGLRLICLLKTSLLQMLSQSQMLFQSLLPMLSESRCGLPDIFLSDNGPHYTSQTFLNFAKTYGFKLITRSPYNAKATGKAEAAAKKAKKMF